MGKVFIAFAGYSDQQRRISKKSKEIEIWNLKSLKYNTFENKVKDRICPSISEKVETFLGKKRFSKCYKNCNWGILFETNSVTNYDEIYVSLLAMQLFSGLFLPVMFYITEDLVLIENEDIDLGEKAYFHNVDRIFNKKFLQFYNIFSPSLKGTNMDTGKINKWNKEQFRIYTSLLLYNDLKKYQNSKKIISWQKECAEMVTIYENVFSRKKNDNGLFKISQRIEILLGDYFKDEMDEILLGLKKLFNYRNDFIHGSFFEEIQRYVNKNKNERSATGLPDVEWKFLKFQMKVLRISLVSFLFLSTEYKDEQIPELIFSGIMDLKKRNELQMKVRVVLKYIFVE